MKGFKIIIILVVAAFLIVPATAQARGPRISFSLNFFEPLFFAPPPPAPVPVYVPCPPPCPPPYVERQTVIREYYYGYPYSNSCPHHYAPPPPCCPHW